MMANMYQCQSLGWEHYEVHEPEPHIMLFKSVSLNPHQAHAFANSDLGVLSTTSLHWVNKLVTNWWYCAWKSTPFLPLKRHATIIGFVIFFYHMNMHRQYVH